MTATLIAAIRRLPGGLYVKVPKSQTMPAMPVHTTADNLATYFTPWPKKKSQFLMYGPRRLYHSATPGLDDTSPQKVPTNSKGMGPEGDSEEFTLYGGSGAGQCGSFMPPPRAERAASATKASGGPGNAGTAATVAASRPLGLAGVMRRFQKGQRLTMVTAYDFPSARLAHGAGAELVLVGDSLGNCRLGLGDTVGVTMEDMLRATASVRRGIDAPLLQQQPCTETPEPKPLLVGDMPFGSYLIEAEALRNAAAFRMAGAEVVKLEGGRHVAPLVNTLTRAGIAVMGHIGLEPQKALLQGGLKLQGTTAKAATEIVEAAQELATAGAVMLVLECVPVEVGRAVQAAVPSIPVIGIGAGGEVAGQVLVCDDLLGLHGSVPSFVKRFADVGAVCAEAYAAYRSEVRSGAFPGQQHSRRMKPQELKAFQESMPQLDLQPPAPGTPETHGTPGSPGSPGREAAQELEAKSEGQGLAEPGQSPAVQPPPLAQQSHAWQAEGISQNPTHADPADLMPTAPVPLVQLHGSSNRAGLLQIVNGSFVPLSKSHGLPPLPSAAGALRAFSQVAGGPGRPVVLDAAKDVHAWRSSVGSVAFVPTMGNLHEGHLELVDEAKKHADEVLVSIFVNPAQFGPHEDFDRYPRTFEKDLALLEARGVSAVFVPTPVELYPHGSPGGTLVVPRFVQGKSEDACRPHFFTGVATVCLKLFNLCRPNVVVFGQKDAMQCAVISRMLEDLMLGLHISLVVAPTSREEDGLARSSRNSYLTPGMRQRAPAIHAALKSMTGILGTTAGSVREGVRKVLEDAGMEVSYVSVADPQEMEEKADGAALANAVVSVACLLRDEGKECRLIDNVVVPADA